MTENTSPLPESSEHQEALEITGEQPTTHKSNPFIGPRAYQTGEKLYGRDRETNQLFNLLTANRVVLLYSPSGAGKSSLIYAGLIPELKKEEFNPLPVMRVNAKPPAELAQLSGFNRYVFSVLSVLEEALFKSDQPALNSLAQTTLNEYFARFDGANNVFIFDQFEEILTQDPTDQSAKQEFFHQLAVAFRHPTRRALFAIREDHIASLDPFRTIFPMLFANPFRLDLLTRDTSVEVMQNIAEQEKIKFERGAAEKLAADLSTVNVQRADNTLESRPGIYVEPVQLQVVCFNLWQKLEPDDQDITLAEIDKIGDVDESLGAYYDQRVADVAKKSGVRERFIREWIDKALTTENNIRTQVLRGSEEDFGLNQKAAEMLENSRVIRAEALRGAVWYELAHDRLVKPVKQSNQHWFEEKLSLLQKQARLWKEEPTHKQALLLREASLKQAQEWAQENPENLTEDEQFFLEESLAAQRAEIEKRQREQQELEEQKLTSKKLRRRLWYALIAMGIAILLMVVACGLTFALWDQQDVTSSGAYAGLAMDNQDSKRDLALLLAIQAYDQRDTYQARNALMQLLQTTPEITQYLPGHTNWVSALAASPDGTKLASAGWDDMLRLWKIGPESRELLSEQPLVDVLSIAFNPDGNLFATGSCGQRDESGNNCLEGSIRLWDADTAEPVGAPMLGHSDWLTDIIFSPDGQQLISGSEDGQILIWDVDSQILQQEIKSGHANWMTSMAVNHNHEQPMLASAGCVEKQEIFCSSAEIFLWDLNSTEKVGEMQGGQNAISSMSFSPDDTLLSTGGWDWKVRLWSVEEREEILPAMDAHSGTVSGVEFSPDGSFLISTGQDSQVLIWDVDDHAIVNSLVGHSNGITSLAAIPGEENLQFATGGRDGDLIMWQIDDREPLRNYSVELDFPIIAMDITPDGKQLLIGSCNLDTLAEGCLNAEIHLYDLENQQVEFSTETNENQVIAAAISPDGSTYATGGCAELDKNGACLHGIITLWDASTRQPLDIMLEEVDSWVTGLAFSPNGSYLAASWEDGSVRLWNTEDWSPVDEFLNSIDESFYYEIYKIIDVVFSPDSSQLAILICTQSSIDGTCWDGEIRYLNMNNFSIEDTLRHNSVFPWSIDYNNPEQDTRLAASLECKLYLEDTEICENAVMLWYIEGENSSPMAWVNVVTDPLLSTLVFHPDQNILITGDHTGELTWWDIDPDSWRAKACQLAGRNLTQKEWDQYFESWQSYQSHCSQWPQGQ